VAASFPELPVFPGENGGDGNALVYPAVEMLWRPEEAKDLRSGFQIGNHHHTLEILAATAVVKFKL
jgi:hypothetical protein